MAQRKGVLEKLLAPFGVLGELGESRHARCGGPSAMSRRSRARASRAARSVAFSTAPTRGSRTRPARCTSEIDAELLYDWAGGLIWAALPARTRQCAAGPRCHRAAGGHATLIRAPAAVRAVVEVFPPEAPALAALWTRCGSGGVPNDTGRAGIKHNLGGGDGSERESQ